MSNSSIWATIIILEIVVVAWFNILYMKINKVENKIDSLKEKQNETDNSVR